MTGGAEENKTSGRDARKRGFCNSKTKKTGKGGIITSRETLKMEGYSPNGTVGFGFVQSWAGVIFRGKRGIVATSYRINHEGQLKKRDKHRWSSEKKEKGADQIKVNCNQI